MRWKLLRRRLSVSAPRMIVRSLLPWPFRWAAVAAMLGFSAALALWTFEFGKDIAGLDRNAKAELARLRDEVSQLRIEHAHARQIADTADSLLKTERTALERVSRQVRQLQADKQTLQTDLSLFERLLPAGTDSVQLRGLQTEAEAPGQLRYQMLLVHSGKSGIEFKGRYELLLSGQLDGQMWTQSLPGGPQPLQIRQVTRVEGTIFHPAKAVLKTIQIKVTDAQGAVRATKTLRL
ncbi:MAG: hypothetical protein LH480_12240 [Rubrivivax sp.]|nr:hypothetical protein [Rubrivivax sp.]